MMSMNIYEAQANLDTLISDVENGESVIITRDNKPAAVMIPAKWIPHIEKGDKLNFADFLMSIPSEIDNDRNSE